VKVSLFKGSPEFAKLFQVGGADVLKKRAERFGASASASSTTVVSQPVSVTMCYKPSVL